nr:Imm1 family immunity protein [Nitrobacter sp. 62-13]
MPFPVAWKAVKEFIETDGELPTSIEWVANSDLSPETFPDP